MSEEIYVSLFGFSEPGVCVGGGVADGHIYGGCKSRLYSMQEKRPTKQQHQILSNIHVLYIQGQVK